MTNLTDPMFHDDDAARAHFEALLWPNGPVCPHCKNAEQKTIWKIEANKEKKIRSGRLPAITM